MLGVLDGAVLVVSAVEGVQSQTRILMRALQRLRVPDARVRQQDRPGGARRTTACCARSREKLTPAVVPMGRAEDVGSDGAYFTPFGAERRCVRCVADRCPRRARRRDPRRVRRRRGERLVRRVSGPSSRRRQGSRSFTRCSSVPRTRVPASTRCAPASPNCCPRAQATPTRPSRAPSSRSTAATPGRRSPTSACSRGRCGRESRLDDRKVTGDRRVRPGFDDASAGASQRARSALVCGLGDIRIGDTIGKPAHRHDHHFAPPTLETVVVPRHAADRAALHVALTQLAEQDPLIDVRRTTAAASPSLSLYGEVQKEVIQATLANDFGVEVGFRETTTICIERPAGTGEAVEVLGRGANRSSRRSGLRVEPGEGRSVSLRLDLKVESIPLYVYKETEVFRQAVEATCGRRSARASSAGRSTTAPSMMTQSGYASPEHECQGLPQADPARADGGAAAMPAPSCASRSTASTSSFRRKRSGRRSPRSRDSRRFRRHRRSGARRRRSRATSRPPRSRRYGSGSPALTHGEGVLECNFSRYEPVTRPAAHAAAFGPQPAQPRGVPPPRRGTGARVTAYDRPR